MIIKNGTEKNGSENGENTATLNKNWVNEPIVNNTDMNTVENSAAIAVIELMYSPACVYSSAPDIYGTS